MERAEGADEGPERSQARTKQRNQAKGAMMIGLSTTRTSIYGGHMMWLCNGWRRGPEARYSAAPSGTIQIPFMKGAAGQLEKIHISFIKGAAAPSITIEIPLPKRRPEHQVYPL